MPLKLDWNETTIPPSPQVISRIMSFLSDPNSINWYPDVTFRELLDKLGSYVGLSSSCILPANGSDDALELICRTYLDSGDRVVVPYPTYNHFLVFASARGARIRRYFSKDPFRPSLRGLMNAVSSGARLTYLINPNNPTGVLYSRDDIQQLLEIAPQSILVVDEAYHEFCGVSVVDLIDQYPNLVVTRTLSKSFGVAGVRLGYLVAQRELVRDMRRIFNPKSVNGFAQVAACAALDDLSYLSNYVQSVNRSKQLLVDYLLSRGVDCRTTPANFIMVKLSNPPKFIALLEEAGIYVRDRSNLPQLRKYVRISVGTAEQTEELIRRLKKVLKVYFNGSDRR